MEKERKTSKFPTIKKMKEPEKSESPPKKVAKLSIKEVPNTETTILYLVTKLTNRYVMNLFNI